MKRIKSFVPLLVLASLILAADVAVAQQYQTYRKARPAPLNSAAAKILMPLVSIQAPPLELDKTLKPEDADLVLEGGNYTNFNIPPNTIVYVKKTSFMDGNSSVGEGVVIMLAPKAAWSAKGEIDTMTVGTPGGKLVQILGQGGDNFGFGLALDGFALCQLNNVVIAGHDDGLWINDWFGDGKVRGSGVYALQNTVCGIRAVESTLDLELDSAYVANNGQAALILLSYQTVTMPAENVDVHITNSYISGGIDFLRGRFPSKTERFQLTVENTTLDNGFIDYLDSLSTAGEFTPEQKVLVKDNRFGTPYQVWPRLKQQPNAADFNIDGAVDFTDFFIFADNFGKSATSFAEGKYLDLDHSNAIDFGDFFIFADNFGDRRQVGKLMALANELLGLPGETRLEQNYPNPFNSDTTIPFAMAVAGEIKLVIYNLAGQQVRTLVEGLYQPGQYQVLWDGADDSGQAVASGTYLYQLRIGAFTKTCRLLLLR